MNFNFEQFLYYFLGFLPFILSYFFLTILYKNFFRWREYKYHVTRERVLLEIKIPHEITKTPLAMEMIFQTLYDPSGERNWLKKLYEGKRRPQFSIEIESDGGKIRFYIRIEKKYQKRVEAAFYAQYPSVELVEVEDYTKFVSYDVEKQFLEGGEFGLSKADPYPIKTYDKFGLDQPGLKPEEVQDPLSLTLTNMGMIEPGDKMWLQIICKAQIKDDDALKSFWKKIKSFFTSGKFKKKVDWEDEANKIVKELEEKTKIKSDIKNTEPPLRIEKYQNVIEDILDNINKPSFWVTIRVIYLTNTKAKEKKYKNLLGSLFTTANTKDYNGIWLLNDIGFNYPWDDYKDIRENKEKVRTFRDYKRRVLTDIMMGHKPKRYFTWFRDDKIKYKPMRFSTTELATIFHLPFSIISPPTLERSKFKKSEAPVDLPY